MRLKAATLAVGTEVVDGQITDRNSAWISDRCVTAGLEMIEHRAVPDDRAMITEALSELSSKVDLLFVTGGLGPTSDDFTRDLIAEVYRAPLEYHEASWQKIVSRFEARGAVAKPIQRQQCFFPRGAAILDNPMGTANAFTMPVVWHDRRVFVVVLPGPPAEIAAVWDEHLAAKIESLVPPADHEDLHVWQTLGLGEGDIAEKVEEAIVGSGLRVGYRVHLPYVEVKIWVKRARAKDSANFIDKVESALEIWTVAHGKLDLADRLIAASYEGHNIVVVDQVTGGLLQSRLSDRLKFFRKERPQAESRGSLLVTTSLTPVTSTHDETPVGASIYLSLVSDDEKKQWSLKMTGPTSQTLAVQPSALYNFGTDRGLKYVTEKVFHLLSKLEPFLDA